MPGSNDYLPFGTGSGANVMTQATYAALAARGAGFSSGTAISLQLNKAWRQSSVMAAVMGQIIANSGANAVDDGNVTVLVAQFLAALQTELSIQTPIGSIVTWPAGTPPAGWLECDGSARSRTGATGGIFTIIGTTYGGGLGDGLTFSLPDLRGLFVRGWDHGRGIDTHGGRPIATLQSSMTAVPATATATHRSIEAGTTGLVNATNPSVLGFARAAKSGEQVTVGGTDASEGTFGETDCLNVSGGDAETCPINIALMFIIRYQ